MRLAEWSSLLRFSRKPARPLRFAGTFSDSAPRARIRWQALPGDRVLASGRDVRGDYMQAESSQSSLWVRTAYLSYGVVCYALFLATFLYAVGFVGNFWGVLGLAGPAFRSMDVAEPNSTLATALIIDLGLLALFALQHSGMARPAFKLRWKRYVPEALERSTYVLFASVCLALLLWQWRPLATVKLWEVASAELVHIIMAVAVLGWTIVLLSTFMIDHFDLFGLRQVWLAFVGRPYPSTSFRTPALYTLVRHPIYLGFLIAFWATPTMTLDHALFAGGTTLYVLIAIQLEERDLIARFGEQYREYRGRVHMLLPLPRADVRAAERHAESGR